jgi:hypothetical protein
MAASEGGGQDFEAWFVRLVVHLSLEVDFWCSMRRDGSVRFAFGTARQSGWRAILQDFTFVRLSLPCTYLHTPARASLWDLNSL